MVNTIFIIKELLYNKRIFFFTYFLAMVFFVFINGCGYLIEGSNPPLPNEAKTIAILPVQNQTFIAGLETDLSEQLNYLLRSNSSLKISPPKIADLQLSIILLDHKTSPSELSKEQISNGITASITGEAILFDTRINNKIWKDSMLEVHLTESLENEMETISGISLSGRTRQVIKLFAEKIYNLLFNNF